MAPTRRLALHLLLLVQISETVILLMPQSLQIREVPVVLQIGLQRQTLVIHQLLEAVVSLAFLANGAGTWIACLLTLSDI